MRTKKSSVDLCNRKRRRVEDSEKDEAPKKRGAGRPTVDDVWKAQMINKAIEPLLDPSEADLLDPENAYKYI